MFFWLIVGGVLAALWLSRVVDSYFGMRRIPDLTTPEWNRPLGRNAPPLTIVVPARNEEQQVEACLRSLLALDYPNYQIIAVNDRSTDATGEILNRMAEGQLHLPGAAAGRLRVLHIDHLPDGWLGKTHAMWAAARQSPREIPAFPNAGHKQGDGGWLLFTDADVVFRPDTLRRTIGFAEAEGADHLVLAPELQMHTAGERMMLAFFQILFLFGHRPWKVADPRTNDSIGVGAFNLIRRSVYERLGTYRALRMCVLDDMKLGELVKARGFRQRYVLGGDLVSLRWARGAFGVVDNLTKNFFAFMQYKVWKAIGFTLLLVLFNMGPFVGAACAPGLARIGYGAALLMIACLYLGMSWHSQVTPQYFFLHPLGSLLFVYTMLRSITLTLWRGGVVWRGTRYPLEELRREMV